MCFLTAGKIDYGIYWDIFNEEKNQFIQKPIENKELINRVNGIMDSRWNNHLAQGKMACNDYNLK